MTIESLESQLINGVFSGKIEIIGVGKYEVFKAKGTVLCKPVMPEGMNSCVKTLDILSPMPKT